MIVLSLLLEVVDFYFALVLLNYDYYLSLIRHFLYYYYYYFSLLTAEYCELCCCRTL